MGEFTGRVVLITGAHGGLGPAVVRAFAEAGAGIATISRPGTGHAGPEPDVLEIGADLSDPEGARNGVDAVLKRFGQLDALLHLVGGFEGGQPVHETTDATWNHMLGVNLHAAFHIIRAALPPMLAAGRGRIVAIGSRTGFEPAANLSAYAVSKAALAALIRTVALEVRGKGITTNLVSPSVIDTPANRAANSSADFSRWVKPESIAQLLLWLTSDAAADINGAMIPIYGRA